MGKVYDLLKAAIAGKSDTLAKWREAVSLAIDGDQVGTGTGVLQVALTLDTAAFVASTPRAIVWDGQRIAENVAIAPLPIGTEEMAYDAATGFITLTPGLYDLELQVVGSGFATPATDILTAYFALSTVLGTPLYSTGGNAVVRPGASTDAVSSRSGARIIYRVAAGANIVIAAVGLAEIGATTVMETGSTAIVRKLS